MGLEPPRHEEQQQEEQQQEQQHVRTSTCAWVHVCACHAVLCVAGDATRCVICGLILCAGMS
jgi:hypothetical protein